MFWQATEPTDPLLSPHESSLALPIDFAEVPWLGGWEASSPFMQGRKNQRHITFADDTKLGRIANTMEDKNQDSN